MRGQDRDGERRRKKRRRRTQERVPESRPLKR